MALDTFNGLDHVHWESVHRLSGIGPTYSCNRIVYDHGVRTLGWVHGG